MDNQVYKIVKNEDLNDSFRINLTFTGYSLNLIILQKMNSFSAQVDQNAIQKQAEQFETDLEEYYNKLKTYFVDTPVNVKFTLSKNQFIIHCWAENNVKIKYFSCPLKKVNYCDCVEELLDNLHSERNETQKRLAKVCVEKVDSDKVRDEYESKLSDFIQRKHLDDTQIFSSFALVLNEKKRRIQHLNELLEAFKRGRPTTNPPPAVRRKKKELKNLKVEVKKEEISESDSDEESVNYDTDNEEKISVNEEEQVVDEDQPSTSKRVCDFILEDEPSQFTLPKRIKSTTSLFNNVNCEKTKNNLKEPKEEPKEEIVDKPPGVIDFNTQELFDML